jgi:hypothetical protein
MNPAHHLLTRAQRWRLWDVDLRGAGGLGVAATIRQRLISEGDGG